MKKTYWFLLAVFILVVLILIIFRNFLNSGFMLVFTALYFIQFLAGLSVITWVDKSVKPVGAYIYFFVSVVVFIILFIKLIPA